MKPSTMAAWPMNNLKLHTKSVDTNDMVVMPPEFFSHKPGVDLIQNCDLPPPQKIFTASDKAATATASMTTIHRVKDGEEFGYGGFGTGSEEKLELLKALRLSQTRAREAEKKLAKLAAERDCISKAFIDEARLIFCYRQSIKLLELRVSKLQYQWQEQERERERERDRDSDRSLRGKEEEEEEEGGVYGDENDGGGMKWVWALAVCLSVAGVGFVLGYTSFM